MALSSYYVSLNRKDLAERAIVSKREREASRAQRCKEVASYHKELALKSEKYKNLEEGVVTKTPRANEESVVKLKLQEDAKEKLVRRRQKLFRLLDVENKQYMEELKRLSDKEREKDPWNICRLKEQIEDLQRKRKEGEQNMQKRYMHHLFKSNSCSKETDEELLQKEIAQAWEKRKEELEKLSIEKQEKEREKIKILESEQLKATREAREVEMEQLKEQESWANFIQKKMDDLNAAENETKKLKAEKDILIEHMETLLSLQQRRDLVRDLQRKGFQRIQSMWQPRDKLRRMLNEVQHGLDFDSKLLVSLSEMNSTATEDTALALLNLDSVKETKEKINMQIALEKERELEIQQLYHEEASTLWEERKEDWYLESVARDQIMNDLFKTLADEINKKLDYNLEQQRKYVHLKETCLKEIDEENEKVRQAKKTLEEKERYFIERAKRLGEELESITAIKCELPARK